MTKTKATSMSIRRRPSTILVVIFAYITLIVQQYTVDRTTNGSSSSSSSIVVDAAGRIVGGTTVTDNTTYPFYAVPDSQYLCGASLIWGNVLVTAAHCGEMVWSAGVWLGGTQRSKSVATFYNVSKIVIHPRYNSYSNWNDIALLFIDGFITHVPYATVNNVSSIPSVSSIMTAIGYGRLAENGPTSNTLQQVDLEVESYKRCAQVYYDISNRLMVCNRGLPQGGKDTCNGDSGGPLFVKDTTTIVGLVSYGYGCARRYTPAVNTRISAYNSWIQVTICSQKSASMLPSYCYNRKRRGISG